MNERTRELVAKVPQITLLFWIIKILATTLGETGGDARRDVLPQHLQIISLIELIMSA